MKILRHLAAPTLLSCVFPLATCGSAFGQFYNEFVEYSDKAPHGVFPDKYVQGETVGVGTLKGLVNGLLIIDAGAAGEVRVPILPITSAHLQAPGTMDLIKPGSVVRVRSKVDWDSFYKLGDAEISMQLEPPREPTLLRLQMQGDQVDGLVVTNEMVGAPPPGDRHRSIPMKSECTVTLYATVLRTTPFVVRCISDTRGIAINRNNTAVGAGIHGASFSVAPKDDQKIVVNLGKRWDLLLAGKPVIEVRFNRDSSKMRQEFRQPGGGPIATLVFACRDTPLTAEELNPTTNKKAKRK